MSFQISPLSPPSPSILPFPTKFPLTTMHQVHFDDNQLHRLDDRSGVSDQDRSQSHHPFNQDIFYGRDHPEPRPNDARPYKFYPIKSPSSRRTSPLTWVTAIFCALLWTIIIIGGLTVLIVYLVFRPKIPRFEISSVTLNGAYLDTSTLLNADLTLLVNFTNPNNKIDMAFQYVVIDLYFKGTLIATQGVDRFSERAGESTLRSIHMVTSEVALTAGRANKWANEVGGSEGMKMEVKGSFLTTSDFVGTFIKLSYTLHGHCYIAVGAPPSGVLLSSNCTTKR